MRGCGRRRLEEAAKRGGAAGELRPARPGTAVQRALSRLPGLFRNDDNDRNPVTSSSAGELNRRTGRVRSRAPVHTLSAHRGDPDARLHHGDPDTRPQSGTEPRASRIPGSDAHDTPPSAISVSRKTALSRKQALGRCRPPDFERVLVP